MVRQAGVALGAGLASALLFVVSAKGTTAAALIAYFTALPIMIAGLAFGHAWGLAGAVLGIGAVAVGLGPILGIYALCFALPGEWLSYLALLARPAPAPVAPGAPPRRLVPRRPYGDLGRRAGRLRGAGDRRSRRCPLWGRRTGDCGSRTAARGSGGSDAVLARRIADVHSHSAACHGGLAVSHAGSISGSPAGLRGSPNVFRGPGRRCPKVCACPPWPRGCLSWRWCPRRSAVRRRPQEAPLQRRSASPSRCRGLRPRMCYARLPRPGLHSRPHLHRDAGASGRRRCALPDRSRRLPVLATQPAAAPKRHANLKETTMEVILLERVAKLGQMGDACA